MRVEQQMVRDFMERNSLEVSGTPRLVPGRLAEDRRKYTQEELDEYVEAVRSGDLVGIADALADLLYIVLGTAVAHGIELEPVFHEVHRSNMTKTPLDPVTRKGGKGPGYEPPMFTGEILAEQEAA